MKKKGLRIISLLMVFAVLLASVPSINVKADEISAAVDALGRDQGGGSSKVKNGITYARTGYLCYLVGADGSLVPGMQAYAFKSPNFSELPGSVWYCNSKKGGYSATYWRGYAPWGLSPFNEDKSTNVGQIKQWMLGKESNGIQHAVQFVEDNWGSEITDKFKSGDYVLVAETILNFQPNVKTTSSSGGITREDIIAALADQGLTQYNVHPPEMFDQMVTSVRNMYYAKYGSSGGNYSTVGSPVIGTCSDCIQYENLAGGQSSIFASYTNKVACFAEYIAVGDIGERAGFTAWTGSTSSQISDGDVKNYGVAMFVVACKDPGQSTCDEPKIPTPHPAPDESSGKKTIIKNYRTKNLTSGEVTDDGCFIKKDVASRINIEDETEYRVVEWKVSTTESSIDSISWPVPGSISQSGKKLGLVELKEESEKVLYVLLEKVEQEEEELIEGIDYYINQSQISKRVTLSEAKTNEDAKDMNEDKEFIWVLPALQEECSGHDYISEEDVPYDSDGDGIDDDTHDITDTAYCSGWEITDTEITVALKNELFDQYKQILSDTQYEEPLPEDASVLEYDREQNYPEQEHITDGWDERLVIHRGQDKLTIAEWKGVGLEAADLTSEADMYAVGNTPQGIRKTMDFTDTFDVKIVDNSPDLTTVSEPSTDSGHGICPPDEQDATIEDFLISPLNVMIYTYSGSPDGGFNNTECDDSKIISFTSGSIHRSGVMLPTGTTFSFYPYIEMRYDTLDSKDLPVYVLGQYRRSMTPNDYAEVIWKQQSGENLTLSSKQWSTHAMATTGDDWRQKNSVLPGGAVMNLGIRKEDRQKVTVRTYQTIIEGEGRTQAEFAGAIAGMTEGEARDYHRQYVASVIAGIDNLCVEQYVNTSWSGDPFEGQIVTPGCDLESGFDAENHKASTEDKYYFRDIGGAAAQEGDLDVREVKNEEAKYTFSSNTKGEILMGSDNILNQGQDESGLSNAKAIEINDRTLVVTKLVDAIERNTGNDNEANNITPCWYNEAFDGVTVIVQTTVLETGMVDPSERAAVLDVKLTPKNKGQKDLFSKAYSSQFKMKDTISTYNDKWQVGMFSNLGGSKNVYMEKMEDLYKSKKFYIPNVNTQDLK